MSDSEPAIPSRVDLTSLATLRHRRTLAVLISALFHGAVILAIWWLWPKGEKTLQGPDRSRSLPPQVVEETLREVDRRQTEELRIKLTELRNLQSSIASIREARMKRWERMADTLEQLAPQAATLALEGVLRTLDLLRAEEQKESSQWESFLTTRKASPGAEISLNLTSLGAAQDELRIRLAGLREQQRALRDKLLLSPETFGALIEELNALEEEVSSAIQHFDALNSSRIAFSRNMASVRSLTARVDAARKRLGEAVAKLAEAQAMEAEASAALRTAEVAASQAAPSPSRAIQQALKKAVAEQKRAAGVLNKHRETHNGQSEEVRELTSALQAARQNEEQAFAAFEEEREILVRKIRCIISAQEAINRRLNP